MKIVSVSDLISADNSVRMAWIDKNCVKWFGSLDYIGIIVSGVDELVDEYAGYWDSYASADIEDALAKKFGKGRLAQIQRDDGRCLNEDEKKWLGAAVLEEKLEGGDDLDFERVSRLRFQLNGESLTAIFSGYVQGQGGYVPSLLGIYRSSGEVEIALAEIDGYVRE